MKESCYRSNCDIPTRYIVAIFGFLGFFNVYAMRVNLSVAIVAMVNNSHHVTHSGSVDETACPELLRQMVNESPEARTEDKAEFNWDIQTQSKILGSFFYGYMCTQFIGGVLAENFSAKWVFGLGIFLTSVLTLLTPLVARNSVTAFIFLRVIIGFAEGVMNPSGNVLVGRWAPKMERNRFSAMFFSGMSGGALFTMVISGLLADSSFLGGWPSAFYVFGLLGCIWFVFWAILVYDRPCQHPRISQSELQYILQHQIISNGKKSSIPWTSILSSIPVWALVAVSICHLYGYHMIIAETPTYLSNVLHFDIKTNGALSALPYLLHTLVGCSASCIADRLRQSGKLRITTIRKIFNSIGFFGPAACLFSISYCGCRPILIVALLCAAMTLNGCVFAGCAVTHVDMSPEHGGTLMGITNTFGSTTGFLAPYVVGQLTSKGQTIHNWGLVFTVASAVYCFGGIVYFLFCSAELQPWCNSSSEETTTNIENDLHTEDKSRRSLPDLEGIRKQ